MRNLFKKKARHIASTEFVADCNADRFARMMQETIGEMQKRGLEVDVQYQMASRPTINRGNIMEPIPNVYTALIIGREVN